MKVVLYSKSSYSKLYISEFKSSIDNNYTCTTAKHLATVFDTVEDKGHINYFQNTFGFNFKTEKINDQMIQDSKNMNRIYIKKGV